MSKENENKSAVAGGPVSIGESFKHPVATHDQDTVVVEVVWPEGVKDDGKLHKPPAELVMKRGLAEAQNKAHAKEGKKVFRFVRTIRYFNDPKAVSTATDYEDSPGDGLPVEMG